MHKIIKQLRDGESLELYRDGLYTKIHLNKRTKRIRWERWISRDNKSWINWNLFLSLREVLQIYNNNEEGKTN